MEKEPLFGKTLEEINQIVKSVGMPQFTGKQIADWLYKKRVKTIQEMSNISQKSRDLLDEKYVIGLKEPIKVDESVDGTKKYLFNTAKNQFIEAAYIPEVDRKTLCVSSQSGCKMGCLFCMTGKQGFQSNLTANEILNQMVSISEGEEVSNLVYMGMGEPMDNIEEVLKSLSILTSEWGFAWSPRRINVSTIGVIPAMQRFIKESEAHLAISLHSPFNEERKRLMPIESVYPANEVVAALKDFDFGRQRRISFEYIMFKDVNDSDEHIKGLLKLLNGVRCRINLIHFHPIPESPLRGSDFKRMEFFKTRLTEKGIQTTIRRSRGEDIFAACGMLSTKEMVKKGESDY